MSEQIHWYFCSCDVGHTANYSNFLDFQLKCSNMSLILEIEEKLRSSYYESASLQEMFLSYLWIWSDNEHDEHSSHSPTEASAAMNESILVYMGTYEEDGTLKGC